MNQIDENDGMLCKLCFGDITGKKFQVIGEAFLKASAFLSLNVSLDEKDLNYVCNDCSEKVFTAFDFKRICLDTENSLVPYVDSEQASQVDLRDVYLEIKGIDNITVTADQQVCRLCMCIVNDEFKYLKELCDGNMVEKYIQEINFNITKDPVVCKQCLNSLDVYIDCLRKWMDIEKIIKIEAKDLDDDICIKSEEVDLKLETCEDGGISLHGLNEDMLNGSSTSTIPNKSSLITHQLRHKDPSEGKMYKCDECDYQSNRKDNVVTHQLRHKDPLEMKMYKCDECDYQAKQKCHLTRHKLRHRDPSEVQMYKCAECDYQSNRKYSVITHQLQHKDPSEVQMYRCDECNFQSKRKYNIITHQLRHKNPSEVQMYRCLECDFQSKQKCSLTRHQLLHRDPSEVRMYRCDVCDFQTMQKSSLTRHQLRRHREASEVKM